MLATCHLLTGAAIGSLEASPGLTMPAAFFSHYVLDSMPHIESIFFQKGEKRDDNYYPTSAEMFYTFVDVIVGTAAVLFLYLKFTNPLILYSAFFGILPDIIDNVPFWYRIRRVIGFRQLHKFHDKIHFDLNIKQWFWGIPLQAVLIGVILWYFIGS